LKAFHFRLQQALRWRTTQLDLAKTSVAAAAKKLQDIRSEIRICREDLEAGARQIQASDGTAGSFFVAWGAFTQRMTRRLPELENSAAQAEKALAVQLNLLVEANRKMRLLEKLRDGEKWRWQAAFDRELETFAGECSLFRLQLRNRMGA